MSIDLSLLRLIDGTLPEPGYISGGEGAYTPDRAGAKYSAPYRRSRIVGGEVVRIPLLTGLQDVVPVDDAGVAAGVDDAGVAAMRAIWQIDVRDCDTAVGAVTAWEAVVDRHLAVLATQPLSVLFPSTADFYRIMMPKE